MPHVLQAQLDRIEREQVSQRTIEALRWHHQHEVLHTIANGVDDILDIVVKQEGGMSADEVAAVAARLTVTKQKLAAMAADKPK